MAAFFGVKLCCEQRGRLDGGGEVDAVVCGC